MKDIPQFLGAGVFEAFAAFGELLVDLDGRFLHDFVRFLGAADEEKIVAAREPLVAVLVVETDAQHAGLRLRRFRGGGWGFFGIQAIASCHESSPAKVLKELAILKDRPIWPAP